MTEPRIRRAAIEENDTLVLGFRSLVQLREDLGTAGSTVVRCPARGTKEQWAASTVR